MKTQIHAHIGGGRVFQPLCMYHSYKRGTGGEKVSILCMYTKGMAKRRPGGMTAAYEPNHMQDNSTG